MAVYEYCTFRISRGAWPRLSDAVFNAVDQETRGSSGSVFLLCAGLIGFASDEGVLIRSWPDEATLDRSATSTLSRGGVIDEWAVESLTPTVRPLDATPPREPGVYAHRRFWLEHEHWDEFQRFSEHGIWPYFESDGCRIIGLWRGAAETGLCKALLVTNYPSVAHWERTRLQSPEPPPGANAALYRHAQEAGRMRAAITERSIVRLTRIMLPRR